MGTYSRLKKKKLHPWFCIVCELLDGTTKLPREIEGDPYPNILFVDMMMIDSDVSARLFVRAETTKDAKNAAKRQLDIYLATRPKKKEAVAA